MPDSNEPRESGLELPPRRDRAATRLRRFANGALAAFLVTSVFSIALSQAAAVLALGSWLASKALKRDRRVEPAIFWPFALFFLVSLVSAVFASARVSAFRELSDLWLVGLLFLVIDLYRPDGEISKPVRILLVSGAVSAAYALTQSLRFGSDYRIHGTLGHYMTFSGVTLVVALLALSLLLLRKRGYRDFMVSCVLLVSIAALLMTHTRGAWLGFLAGAIVVLGYRSPRLILVVPVLAAVLFLLAPGPVKSRILSIGDLGNVTTVERFYMWRSGLEIFKDHPVLGVGPGNVGQIYPDYKAPDDPWLPWREFSHLHSNVVQIAAERGILGLLTWFSIWFVFLLRAHRGVRDRTAPGSSSRALVAGSMAVVTGFLVAGVFEYNFGDSEVIALVYFVMALAFVPSRSDGAHGADKERADIAE
jgi:O-antigen ligase